MMYRHTNLHKDNSRKGGRRHKRRRALWRRSVVLLLVAVGCTYAFINYRNIEEEGAMVQLFTKNGEAAVANVATDDNAGANVVRTRIDRTAIPAVNFNAVSFRELFNDSNYVQLSAARASGIDPATLGDPAKSNAVVPIFSTALYQVDTMYHAMPYLVPEAALLLHYIGLRFHELTAERYPDMAEYKIIVTSALRTEESVRRLRRVNRNATDTSCHLYGTTFDISAQRFETADGRDTVVEQGRQMLAQAVYELRYEGLCYVKYESNSCFHITLRTTQYEGSCTSSEQRYTNPGSPEYQLTKAAPRPKPRPVATPPAQSSTPAAKPAAPAQRHTTAATPSKGRRHKETTTPRRGEVAATPATPTHTTVTERERLSLEQYERRY